MSAPAHARGLAFPLILLAVLYVGFTAWVVSTRGIFEYAGGDFRGGLASAELIRDEGFAAVYDNARQAGPQAALYDAFSFGPSRMPFEPWPFPYLPVFVAPFLAFLPLAPAAGYAVFVAANLILLVLYYRRFLKAIGLTSWWWLALLCLSVPVFLTLFFGQVNGWIVPCMGEFLLAVRARRDGRAGLWLSGLLLKPQALVLFVLGLFLARRWRLLLGLVSGAAALLLASLAVGGPGALEAQLHLLTSREAMQATFPGWMMNFRALAHTLSGLGLSRLAWGAAIAGSFATGVPVLLSWRLFPQLSSRLLLATLAATFAVTPHAHVYMAAPLGLVLALLVADGADDGRLLAKWTVGPALVFVLSAFVFGTEAAHRGLGLLMLAVNVALVVHSVRRLPPPRALNSAAS